MKPCVLFLGLSPSGEVETNDYTKEDLGKAGKFLYWGNDGEGRRLLIVGHNMLARHKDVLEHTEAWLHRSLRAPDGAGSIKGRVVESWDSQFLDVETPPHLHWTILDLLGLAEERAVA